MKVIDFGSSCKSDNKMYSYIQSRFYRSPEVMLGLPYTVAIDMWSLGCILVEMHTGEPLFSGSDQVDQMQKIVKVCSYVAPTFRALQLIQSCNIILNVIPILLFFITFSVKILGMVPDDMLEQSSDTHRDQFFECIRSPSGEEWVLKQAKTTSSSSSQQRSSGQQEEPTVPSSNPIESLADVIKKYPPREAGHSVHNYDMFVDLIYKMLSYKQHERMKPEEALQHPFILSGEHSHSSSTAHHSSTPGRQHSDTHHPVESTTGQTYVSSSHHPSDTMMHSAPSHYES